jgi:hypothetical protein
VSQDKADAIVEAIEGNILTTDDAFDDAKPALEGRYVSDELQATYDVRIAGDVLTAVVASRFARAPGEPLELKQGADGSFTALGTRLIFDEDGQGFTIKTARVHAIRFRRAS